MIASPADTLLAFVNTRADGAGKQELFGNGSAFAAWLHAHEEYGRIAIVTDADAAAARELRDALVTAMLAHSGDDEVLGEPLRTAEQNLIRAGSLYPLAAVVSERGVSLSSPQSGVAHVFGTVLAAAAELAQRGDWGRIKACRNPPCHLGFLDRTRNASALYCSSACGSQVSMRNYRRRQKQRVTGYSSSGLEAEI